MLSLQYIFYLKNSFLKTHYMGLSVFIALLSSMSIITIGFVKSFILIMGVVILLIGIFNTRWFLYILLFILPFAYLLKGFISSTVIEYGLVLLFVSIWLMKITLSNKRVNLPPTWFIALIFIYLAWLTVSNIHAGLGPNQVSAILRSIAFFSAVFAFYDTIKVSEFLETVWALMIPYIFLFFYTILIFAKSGGLLNIIYMIITMQGDILAPNRIGGIYMMFLPILFSIFIYDKKTKYRAVYSIVFVLFLCGLILTNTRSAYLGAFISLLYFIIISKKRKVWISCLAVLIIIYLSIPSITILTDLFLRVEGGVSNRHLIWKETIKLFRENYIFGIGSNVFNDVIGYKLPLIYYRYVMPLIHNAHNYPLRMAIQMGIPGLFIILYIFYKFTVESIKCQMKNNNDRIKALSIGISAMMFAVIARAMFEAIGIVNNGNLFPDIYFWIIMCYPLKILNNEHNRKLEYIW